MNKYVLYGISLLVVSYLSWISYQYKYDDKEKRENPIEEVISASDLNDGSDELDITSGNPPDNQSALDTTEIVDDKSINKISFENSKDYSDNWCSYKELTQQDRDFAKQELEDWELSVGRIMYNVESNEGFSEIGNGYVAAPYLEISKDELLNFIEENDATAMFAALDRTDLRLSEKREIAEKLLVQGYTGKAIQHLVITEMVLASSNYRANNSQITDKVRLHISNALKFAIFSLRNNDAIGFIQLVDMIGADPLFAEQLNPVFVLSKLEIQKAVEASNSVSDSIESQRYDMNLPPFEKNDSKIAKHQMDLDMGMLFGKQPSTMQVLRGYLSDELHQLEATDCRTMHSEMFAKRR